MEGARDAAERLRRRRDAASQQRAAPMGDPQLAVDSAQAKDRGLAALKAAAERPRVGAAYQGGNLLPGVSNVLSLAASGSIPALGDWNPRSDTLLRRGVRFGVNRVYLAPDDGQTRYGTTEEQLDDFANLGADFARHPGSVELSWQALTGDMETAIPAGETAIRTLVFGPENENQNRLAEVLAAAHARGTKLVLTTPLYGGGPFGNVLGGTGAPGAGLPQPDGWNAPLYSNFTRIDTDEQTAFWLDPFNEEKVELLALICQYAGELLVEAASQAGVLLVSVIECLETFNEANARNFYAGSGTPDATTSGLAWGRVHFACARALHDVLAATGQRVPAIRLPALACYRFDEPDAVSLDTVSQMREFLEAMAAAVSLLAALDGVDPALLADGVDYHWYFSEPSEGRDLGHPRHIRHLVQEVEALREALRAVPGLEGANVSVMETGAPSNLILRGIPGPVPFSFRTVQPEELCRRLAGALAAGADRVAWHSWMSAQTSEGATFSGFGLREDGTEDTEPASRANPRSAWGSFYQLARTLQVRTGRMVVPEPDEFDVFGHGLVIFEYELVSGSYAYIILVDPSTREVWRVRSGAFGSYAEYPLKPRVIAVTGGLDQLPDVTVINDEPTRWAGSLSFEISWTGTPRLFVVPRQLSFHAEAL